MQAARWLRFRSQLILTQNLLKPIQFSSRCKALKTSTVAITRQEAKTSYSTASSDATSDEDQKSRAQSESDRRQTRLVSVMIGSAVGFIGASYVLYRKLTGSSAQAEPATVQKNEEAMEKGTDCGQNNEEEEDGEKERKKKRRKGFRDRRIIEYENRIRQYSTPDKVFRYFATLKISHPGAEDNEVFMKPEDFVRSLTPGKKQPEGLGLDEHDKFHPEKHKYKGYESVEIGDDSVFMKMGEHGLISFSDYIFLLTVLSLPPRMFEIAFQMFDLNGDGEVSPDEFEKVQNILFSLTATGSRHRDHSTTGSVLSAHVSSGLRIYFFGQDKKRKLTVQNFVDFQKKLQKEVMFLEFISYEPQDNRITEAEFADMLLTYSSFQEKKKQQILKRVKKAFKEEPKGIMFQDYLDFFSFLRNIHEAEVALSFHIAANKAIDPETFKQVANTITGVKLNDHVVDVVYKMFDENDDGELSHKEFISVMKNQAVRGLENPKDTGFAKLMSALLHCAKHQVYDSLHPRKKGEEQ